MTFQNLYYFVEAARDLNFSKTAERLFVSQQSISKHIGKLEEHYAVKLFERKPNLQLTESGRLIAAKAKQIFRIENDLNQELAQLKSKKCISISVKCNLTKANAFFPEILKRCSEQYPEAQIICQESRTNELGDMQIQTELLNHTIHFYIGEQIPVDSEDIVKLPLLRDRNLFALSRQKYESCYRGNEDLLKRAQQGVSPADFGDLPFLLQEDMSIPSTHAYFLHQVGGLKRETSMAFDHIPLDIMLAMCQQNMGIILLSQLLVYHYVRIGIHTIDDLYFFNASINGIPYYRDLYLYYSRDITQQHAALGDFPAIVQERFQLIAQTIDSGMVIRNGCIHKR